MSYQTVPANTESLYFKIITSEMLGIYGASENEMAETVWQAGLHSCNKYNIFLLSNADKRRQYSSYVINLLQ